MDSKSLSLVTIASAPFDSAMPAIRISKALTEIFSAMSLLIISLDLSAEAISRSSILISEKSLLKNFSSALAFWRLMPT